MRLASRGLGKLTLPFRLEAADAYREDGQLYFQGRIVEGQVNWPYRMQLEDADVVRFVILARNPLVTRYLAQRVGLRLYLRLARALLALVGQVLLAPLRWGRRRAPAEQGAAAQPAREEAA